MSPPTWQKYQPDFKHTPSQAYLELPSDAIQHLPPPQYFRPSYENVVKTKPFQVPIGTRQFAKPPPKDEVFWKSELKATREDRKRDRTALNKAFNVWRRRRDFFDPSKGTNVPEAEWSKRVSIWTPVKFPFALRVGHPELPLSEADIFNLGKFFEQMNLANQAQAVPPTLHISQSTQIKYRLDKCYPRLPLLDEGKKKGLAVRPRRSTANQLKWTYSDKELVWQTWFVKGQLIKELDTTYAHAYWNECLRISDEPDEEEYKASASHSEGIESSTPPTTIRVITTPLLYHFDDLHACFLRSQYQDDLHTLLWTLPSIEFDGYFDIGRHNLRALENTVYHIRRQQDMEDEWAVAEFLELQQHFWMYDEELIAYYEHAVLYAPGDEVEQNVQDELENRTDSTPTSAQEIAPLSIYLPPAQDDLFAYIDNLVATRVEAALARMDSRVHEVRADIRQEIRQEVQASQQAIQNDNNLRMDALQTTLQSSFADMFQRLQPFLAAAQPAPVQAPAPPVAPLIPPPPEPAPPIPPPPADPQPQTVTTPTDQPSTSTNPPPPMP